MADEITEIVSLAATKSNLTVQSHPALSTATKRYDLTASAVAKVSQAVLHSADAALAIPANISPAGKVLIENLDDPDTGNKVSLSIVTGGGFAEIIALRPGHSMIFQPVGTWYIKATTATVTVQMTILPV